MRTLDENGNVTTRYLHYDHLGSVDEVQGSTSAAGGRGTPRGVPGAATITDDQGNVIQSMSDVQGCTSAVGGTMPGAAFDAFGLRRDAANWDDDLTTAQITALKDDTDRGYTFQEQLDNVGLIHMNGRVYDPSIGRFISADPTVPDPLDSQSFNRYSYVYNSPLEYTDPSGFDPCPADKTSCPTKKNGGNNPAETGSHISGVDTGATCSGNCGGWTAMGPGPKGPGNGNEGNGPAEQDPGSGGPSGSGENDNHDATTTAQLGSIQVAGTRITPPLPTPYFTANPFNNIWSYFLFSYSSSSAFLMATPPGYSRLAIRGLQIGKKRPNLPILSTQEEQLLLEAAAFLVNPASLFSSQDLNIPSNDGFFHADIFQNNNGTLNVTGFFDYPNNGNIDPDSESNNIQNFIFGPLIPSSQINFNPSGFGAGSYNVISHNCESYILCALDPGG